MKTLMLSTVTVAAIDLIDDEDLCELLKDLKLGVHTKLIKDVTIDEAWFDKI